MQLLPPRAVQGTNGDIMKHLDEMYPWELEEHLDLQGTRSESEIENYCKDCVYAEECTNKECIKLEDLHVQ